jgi:hypothetical protein
MNIITFPYLGCDITYDTSTDITMQLNKLRHINKNPENKTREETQTEYDKVMAVPFVLNQKEYSSLTQKWFIYSQLMAEQDWIAFAMKISDKKETSVP